MPVMTIPFSIDATGGIAQTSDPQRQLLDRIQGLIGTQPGERVNRAAYGVDSARLLFTADELASTRVQLAVRDAVAAWEPSARVTSIAANVNNELGVVSLKVEVARVDAPGAESANSRSVTIDVGGTVSSLGA